MRREIKKTRAQIPSRPHHTDTRGKGTIDANAMTKVKKAFKKMGKGKEVILHGSMEFFLMMRV